jgi:hypothetical protein
MTMPPPPALLPSLVITVSVTLSLAALFGANTIPAL